MSKFYEKAPVEVEERANRLITLHHKEVGNVGVRIDYVFAFNPDGDAVTHGGYPALAVIKILGLKDRTKGMGDCEITIDAGAYNHMTSEQKDALLDHELHHITILWDAKNNCHRTDDLSRPKLRLRKHDYQMGWFTCIAQRHGMNSPEVYQAKLLWDKDGQAFFPMLMDGDKTPERPKREKLKIVKPEAAEA